MEINKLKERMGEPNKASFRDYHFANFNVFQRYGDVAGKSVAVLGCSVGMDCQMIHAAGATDIIGVDLDPRIGLAFPNENITYLKSSVSNLVDIEDNSVDVIYSVAVFEHVFDLRGAYDEAVRILTPGGLAYIVSSPLWNSAHGHHLKLLLETEPWIHLTSSPEEIVDRLTAMGHLEHAGKSASHYVSDMVSNDAFNRYPSDYYVTLVNQLSGVNILRNDCNRYDLDSFDNLDHFNAAIERGFTSDELLSSAHTCVITKTV